MNEEAFVHGNRGRIWTGLCWVGWWCQMAQHECSPYPLVLHQLAQSTTPAQMYSGQYLKPHGRHNKFKSTYNVLSIVGNVINIANSDGAPLATAECIQGLNDLVYWGPIFYFNCTPPVVSQATSQLEDLAKVRLNTASTHTYRDQLECALLPMDSCCSHCAHVSQLAASISYVKAFQFLYTSDIVNIFHRKVLTYPMWWKYLRNSMLWPLTSAIGCLLMLFIQQLLSKI